MARKIIVLTPVKNEDWILDRFLQVCSQFADHIIIADQQSTDGSLSIYCKYPKVTLLENRDSAYNEAERQLLLINKARQLFGDQNILLALDADEILASNALHSEDWSKMLSAEPGTILVFEKPSLYKDINTVIRFNTGWPLGYVDDGAKHVPSRIHSTRIPTPSYAVTLHLNEIKFIHYNTVRLDAFASKQRMYSMVENINNTSSLRHRLRTYGIKIDLPGMGDRVERVNNDWFNGWEVMGIDMRHITKNRYYWYDYEALKLFNQFGIKRFAYDDLWDFDWESFRQYALDTGYNYAPKIPIFRPKIFFSEAISIAIKQMDKTYLFAKQKVNHLSFPNRLT